MRAAFFREHGGPEVLEVGEAPDPVPTADSVILDVRACALNHLDLWVRRGIPGLDLPLPHIGGSDVAGVVAETGPGVTGWAAGDRVCANPGLWCGDCRWCRAGEHSLCLEYRILGEHLAGGAAERVRVPARNLFRLPESLAWETAAAAPLAFQTAWRGLVGRGGLGPQETLLVTGASGGVATAAVQIGVHLGARVVAVTSGAGSVRRVRSLGAEVVIDRLTEDVAAAVREATDGLGADVVFDSVGEALWETCLRSLARDGRLVVYGATTGPHARIELRHLFWKQQRIIGTTMGSHAEFETVMRLVADGALEPVVDDALPLERIREAHERLESGEAFGKLVLVP